MRLALALSSAFHAAGGIERFNRLLLRAIDEIAPRHGLDVVALVNDDTDDDYARAGSPLRNVRFRAGDGDLRRFAARTILACTRERPDALLVGHLGMSPVGLVARPFLRRGYGIVVHGKEAWHEPRRSRRLAARGARVIWSVSGETARRLAAETGISADVVRILPNALAPEIAAVRAGEAGAAARELLSVTRLHPDDAYKGVDHTLEAFARLASKYPAWRYRIVGAGPDKGRHVDLARTLGLGDRVVFEEGLTDEDLAARYASCGVFVLPSGMEGFGIVFVEAMRFGRACIGGAAGGTPEVIDDGETGILVPYAGVDALTGALDRLMGDGALRTRMGNAGRARIEACFTFDRFRANVERHLGEWLGLGA